MPSTEDGGPTSPSLRELLADPDLFLIGLDAATRDEVLRAVAGALDAEIRARQLRGRGRRPRG